MYILLILKMLVEFALLFHRIVKHWTLSYSWEQGHWK